MTLKSYFLLNYPERAFAFVFREVKQYSSTADGTSLKRKAGIFMCCLEDDKHIDLQGLLLFMDPCTTITGCWIF